MAYFKWTDEYKKIVKDLHDEGMTTSQIITHVYDEYGINLSSRSVQRHMKSDTKKNNTTLGTEILMNKDGSQTSSTSIQMTREEAKDPDFVLRAHGFDPELWQIISAKNNFW